MGYPRKIVTCCYCGTRAALKLSGKTQHELACSKCGAPLHDLKMMPVERRAERETVERPKVSHLAPRKPAKAYKKSKRKGFFKKAFEEAFDILEDVFD